ncbi:MAG: DUF4445 domain-containing protein [Clostridia bacterium]|nr:DUF4445 domain-containing protein [Clostridia bacterium]
MDGCRVLLNGKEYFVRKGSCLGDVLRDSGFGNMICGGHGKCGKCRVFCKGGLSAPEETERRILGDDLSKGVRLACRAYVEGDCSVSTESPGKAVIETDGELPEFELEPLFEKYGAAVDVGTTTVALRLYDRNGQKLAEKTSLNPQRTYGADVVTRMEACLKGEAAGMALAIRGCIDALASEASESAGIDPHDIDAAVITGNTVMLSFLTETDTEPLTHAPFNAERLFGEFLTAEDIHLGAFALNAVVYLPPCISAFIGADTVTALLASGAAKNDAKRRGVSVMTDIGTNGETVLVLDEEILACSTAAGPAFEGAGISMGMGGGEGAIDKVSADGEGNIAAHVIGETEPKGICGSGIIDAVKVLVELGIVDGSGYMEEDPAVIRLPVTVSQKDVRAVQLAKSAICAGIRTLLDTADIAPDMVESLYIAGGFGSFLDVANAAEIGLIPGELKDKVKVLGNAALAGASAILLSRPLVDETKEITGKVRVVELAANPLFAEEYMNGMLF